MWATIVKYAVKIALWAAEHPDQVKDMIDTVVSAKQAIADAKK